MVPSSRLTSNLVCGDSCSQEGWEGEKRNNEKELKDYEKEKIFPIQNIYTLGTFY